MDYICPRLRVHMDSETKKEAPLSETERKFHQVLSKTSAKTFLGKCIHIALAKKSDEAFRKIIPQLKDQLRDAPVLLTSIIGKDAIELLKQL